jgi:hypothetical protein
VPAIASWLESFVLVSSGNDDMMAFVLHTYLVIYCCCCVLYFLLGFVCLGDMYCVYSLRLSDSRVSTVRGGRGVVHSVGRRL